MQMKEPPVDESTLSALCAEGARSAADALARFVEAPTSSLEGPEQVSAATLAERLGDDVTGVGFRLSGGIEGALVHLLTRADASGMLARLPGASSPPAGSLDERARGALSELGNIAASAFLNVIADRLGRSCLPSVPRFSEGGVFTALDDVGVQLEPHSPRLWLSVIHLPGTPAVSLTLVVVLDA